MVFIVEALVSALLGAAFAALFERVVPRKNVTEFLVGKLMSDHENNKILFQNLGIALKLVEDVLSAAVEKQLTSQTNREWVESLTDAVNQTADLLDEIYSRDLAQSQSSGKSALHKIIQKSKGELEKKTRSLEYLAKLKDVHGLKKSSSEKKSSRLESTSWVDESEVPGRDEDKTIILNFLVDEPGQRNGNDIPLIAIIGMAGIGKTTLAQLLFNDSDVKSRFSPRAWVHVSEDMDVVKVTKTLYEKVTGRTSDIQNLDTLQLKLSKKLKNKQFLFVLDDVWNEHRRRWDELQKAFKSAAPESRIIVTTRSQEVASTMRASQTHHLRPLNGEDCWLLFAKQAFPHTDAPLDLKPIAQKKCGGLPLVARELGSLLGSRDAEERENILNGNLFDLCNNKIDILAWFKLSFDHLSSHFLKQSFAYCSIIPKGYTFDKEKLILLWMAQGFLQQLKRGGEMEQVGIKYFEELLAKSFFQQARDDDRSLFVIHDVINEFAQFVSTIQSCLVEKGKSPNISDKTRHVSYICDGHDKEADLVDVLRKAKFLWTFLPLSLSSSSIGSSSIGTEVVKELRKQKQLRVLSLSYQKNKLPKEFEKLRHLRYLDLSDSAIVELPEKISSLYTLQTLILSNCKSLEELPEKMTDLINLGHLDLTGTRALKMMPPAFGKLKSLRILTTFVMSDDPKASSIRELGKLSLLRGKLSILKLQNIRDDEDAENAKLNEKKNVKELEFKWSCNGQRGQEEVLEKLCPHEDIEKLSIAGYGGRRLPNWLGDSSFPKMVILRLSDCRNCSSLLSLGQLSSLQQLHVTNMPTCKQWLSSPVTGGGYLSLQELYVQNCEELTAIPNNLTSLKILSIKKCRQLKFDDFTGYKKLQNLHIRSCNYLKELTLNFYGELESLQIHDCIDLRILNISDLHQDLEFFKELEISECPNLEIFCGRGLPAPNLTSFSVSNCNKLLSMPEQMHTRLSSLQTLIIAGCPRLVSFPDGGLPRSLQTLSINNCVEFHSMPEQMHTLLSSLQTLIIAGCPRLVSFPDGGLPRSLQTLSINNCVEFHSMPEQMHTLLSSLQTLDISDCPNLLSFPNGGLPLTLQTLSIKNCVKLTPQTAWGLRNMTSLTHLKIDCAYDEVTSFPDDGLLPVSLTNLQIRNFKVLKTLDLNGLQDLTLLKELQINCNQLEILSGGILPRSLSDLSITGCASLTDNCKRDHGNYWDKISHIPRKRINGNDLD